MAFVKNSDPPQYWCTAPRLNFRIVNFQCINVILSHRGALPVCIQGGNAIPLRHAANQFPSHPFSSELPLFHYLVAHVKSRVLFRFHYLISRTICYLSKAPNQPKYRIYTLKSQKLYIMFTITQEQKHSSQISKP